MRELRIPTCVFGLKVKETSKAEALHFPWRENVIPVEKRASLVEIFGPFQQFHATFLVKWPQFSEFSFNFHHREQLQLVIVQLVPVLF